MIDTFSNPTDTRGWEIIKKHFFEEDGLLAQVEQGRPFIMKMDTPGEIGEVQEIKEALEIIQQSWEGKETRWWSQLSRQKMDQMKIKLSHTWKRTSVSVR